MADLGQVEILMQGVERWNEWREDHPKVIVDLSRLDLDRAILGGVNLRGANLRNTNLSGAILASADLRYADLSQANLTYTFLNESDFTKALLNKANLSGANLREAKLVSADLSEANLDEADFVEANLFSADLREAKLVSADLRYAEISMANLTGSDLRGAKLIGTDLSGATIRGANLSRAILIETNFEQADISGCRIFGISAWKLKTQNLTQASLIITDRGESEITVDNIEIAQFVYLLLHNEKIRDVISTIGQKAVLILGRFALPERKTILEAMRGRLREKGYLPIVFDFEKSSERDFTETIQVLAGMCLFVIADITNPKSSPLELQATVPNYMIPFAPIIQAGEKPFAMFVDLQHKYGWVLDARQYKDEVDLISNFESGIIKPALAKHNELLILKNEALKIRSIGDI